LGKGGEGGALRRKGQGSKTPKAKPAGTETATANQTFGISWFPPVCDLAFVIFPPSITAAFD
jgi:hypothetical protein